VKPLAQEPLSGPQKKLKLNAPLSVRHFANVLLLSEKPSVAGSLPLKI